MAMRAMDHFLFIFGKKESTMPKLERDFQKSFLNEVEARFPGCMILQIEGTQGIPDRLILYGDRWAVLEFKRDADAPYRPNQPYYLNLMNQMSFARKVEPENAREVFRDLERALTA